LKSIDDQIRDKKAELKAKSRELSALQNELKKKNEPLIINRLDVSVRTKYSPTGTIPEVDGPWVQDIHMETNKYVSNALIVDALKLAIESLSDTPSDPKSYVDWEKIGPGFDWCAIDEDGSVCAFMYMPHIDHRADGRSVWISGSTWGNVPDSVDPFAKLPAWDKSLIHRPGAKE
jgi:hypothetical protein